MPRPFRVLCVSVHLVLRAHMSPEAKRGQVVVTPHAGEMAKFLGKPRDDVERDPRLPPRSRHRGQEVPP